MPRYFAELNSNGVVVRTVVCEDQSWLEQRLGGTWVEASDPYNSGNEVSYPGLGWRYGSGFPEKFVPPRRVPRADIEIGQWQPAPLWQTICVEDEDTWITSAIGLQDVAIFHLGRATGNVRISGRARKNGTGGQSVDLILSILVDGIEVFSQSGPNVPAAWSTYSIDLTLHGDVTLRVERGGSTGGNPNNRRAIEIAWIVMDNI
jgi:hypothetical protein